MASLIFVVLLGFGLYELWGAVVAFATAGLYALAAIIALILGPKRRSWPRLPVRGWDPARTRYDENSLPYLE